MQNQVYDLKQGSFNKLLNGFSIFTTYMHASKGL